MKLQKKNVLIPLLVVVGLLLGSNVWTNLMITEDTNKIEEAWNLRLINKDNPIDQPINVKLATVNTGEQVDERILPFLQEMFDAARADEVYPLVTSGYRTKEYQEKLMNDKVESFILLGHSRKQATKLAKEWVAIPGTSEHELGLAVDINADKTLSTNAQVYDWLEQNSYLYGFILRYPQSKQSITGISYEPWHYRYVGVEAATQMYELDLTLEEYLQ